MTAADKMEFLKSEFEDTLLIGNENESIKYLDALVAIDNFDRAVYDYGKLVECFMKADNITADEAREWIDYNVVRSLPYAGVKAPIILFTTFED